MTSTSHYFSPQRVPPDVWISIFDWVPLLLCEPLEEQHPLFRHPGEVESPWYNSLVRDPWEIAFEATRARIRLVHVCREWRELYIRQAFSSIVIEGNEGMELFLPVLEGTDKRNRPYSLGKWTRRLFWYNRSVPSRIFPLPTPKTMIKILRLLPNLLAFSADTIAFPSGVLDAFLASPKIGRAHV